MNDSLLSRLRLKCGDANVVLMATDDWELKEKREVVESLREQLIIEGELVGLYEEYERGTENKAMGRVMQMFRLDSQRHINIIQAAIELLEGEDVFTEEIGRASCRERVFGLV